MSAADDYQLIPADEPIHRHLLQRHQMLAEIEALRAENATLSASLRFPKDWTQSRAAAELERLRALEASGRVGGVAERAVLDAADAWEAIEWQKPIMVSEIEARDNRLREAVRAWRGAAPTAEETPA